MLAPTMWGYLWVAALFQGALQKYKQKVNLDGKTIHMSMANVAMTMSSRDLNRNAVKDLPKIYSGLW